MSKLLELILDFLKDFSEKYIPLVSRLIRRVTDWKAFAFSWMAHYSRQFGVQAILAIGILASLYAAFQFTTRTLSPETPKPSHDVILKSRFSSPVASDEIVIVDIDERTLALLSAKHGRWPWSREVLADGLQKLSDAEVRAILFNVMLSDPDKNNPDADAAMDITAQLLRPVAFPLIRLAPQNDKDSKLLASQIPGTVVHTPQGEQANLAAIIPMFGSMHDRLGIANQKPDADGIVRKYPLLWNESGYTLPSLVGRTMEVSERSIDALPDTLALNWRNKRGRYARFSFGDLVQDNLSEVEKLKLKNAYVVLSVSAPGLGQIKPTGVSAMEDDGEILATALDDALNNTYLRTMSNWLVLIINLCIIWGLVWVTTHNSVSATTNKLFILVQSALGGITLLSASYTNYLIDLSDSMSFGIALFGAIKLVQNLDDRWSRAKPGFRKIGREYAAAQLMVLGWLDDKVAYIEAQRLQRAIEHEVGMPQVVRVDDLFAGESFVKSHCAKYKCLMVHVQDNQMQRIEAILQDPIYADVISKIHDLQAQWDTENKQFAAEVAPLVLSVGSELLNHAWIASSKK